MINEKTKVLIQGITGREGSERTRFMLEYGTKVLGGVTPGREGEKVFGVPVYNSVKQAIEIHGKIDASCTFVPGPQVKSAVLEAVRAKIKLVVVTAERVPLHDILEMIVICNQKGVSLVGPGSLGLISPGKAAIGWLGGTVEFANQIFSPGPVGIMSRSGGQTSTIAWSLKQSGIGVSTAIHVGSEKILGLSFPEILPLFQKDSQTKVVVLFGEIGGLSEQEAAQIMKKDFKKPLVAYIAGKKLPWGVRFSHSSAIIEGKGQEAESKIKALKEAGAILVKNPSQISAAVKEIVERRIKK